MALINCPNCGKTISDKAEVCPHCGMPLQNNNGVGNPVNAQQQPTPAPAPTVAPAPPANPAPVPPANPAPVPPAAQYPGMQAGPAPKKSKLPLIAIIAAGIAALLIGGGLCAYFFLIKPNQESDETTTYPDREVVDDRSGGDSIDAVGEGETGVSPEEIAADFHVVVTGVNVRLRTTPEINDYNIITTSGGKNLHPKKWDRLEYLGEEGDFYKVRYKGHEAYISKQFAYLD